MAEAVGGGQARRLPQPDAQVEPDADRGDPRPAQRGPRATALPEPAAVHRGAGRPVVRAVGKFDFRS